MTGDEPFYLLTTESLLADGDLDLRNQYENASYRIFFDGVDPLWTQSVPTSTGEILSPHNIGLSLLILPAYRLAGLNGAKGFLAVVAGVTMGLAYVLARRLGAGTGGALAGTLGVAAAAPSFVYASQVYPEFPAALCVTLVLLALTARAPRLGSGLAIGLLLLGLLWLGAKYAPLAAALGILGVLRLHPSGRIMLATIVALGGAHYTLYHVSTYGGLTPYNVNLIYAGASTVELVNRHLEGLNRLYRLLGLWIDREFGVVRWAPSIGVALWGAAIAAWRPTPIRSLVIPVVAVQVLVATFLAITMRGWWFPGRMLVVVLPLFVPLLALAIAHSWRQPWGRFLVVGAAFGTLSATTELVLNARSGFVALAVNPFDANGPWMSTTRPLWPLYTSYGFETIFLSLVWVMALAGAIVGAIRRRQAVAGTSIRGK